jgi:chromosomal replication initiator protein
MQREAALVWQKCLEVIKNNISEQSFKTWFEPIVPDQLYGKTLIIQVPSQFFYEWLEENYVHLLRRALDEAIGRDGMLEYSIIVDSGESPNEPPITVNMPVSQSTSEAKPDNLEVTIQQQPAITEFVDRDSLKLDNYINQGYSFDSFIEGDCNRMARAAGIAVAQKPGLTSFNPLMIYGGVGLGKTHLVQAIGNYIKNKSTTKSVVYVSAEKFTSQFIMAIKENNLQNFNNFYMRVDVLILDDVQFLSGKEKTQETFFHIFNHLHQSGRQIIMTSDRSPRDLEGLQDRLLSRFKWGLTTDLQTPDAETRTAIIMKKCQAEGIQIPYEVIEYMANSIDTNVRELEGVVTSLIAQAVLMRREVDLDLARNILRNIIADSEKEVSIDSIIELVTQHFKISIADIKGKTRLREVVFPRQVAMYICKEMTNLSLKSIGYHFGGRDHSTVIHAIQTVNDLMDTEKDVDSTIKKLMKQFKR